MKSYQTLIDMETLFLALADKTRLRMLNLMREKEVCVSLFTEILNESQPKISRHLAYLRNAGIVETRREGKLIYYRIANLKDAHTVSILENTLLCLENQKEMQSEHEKLFNYCQENNSAGFKNSNSEPNIYAKQNMYAEKDELEIYLL